MEHGTVKWFDPVKGYGFIAGDNGEEAFVHHSDILMRGFRHLETGERVSYRVKATEKGNNAIDVIIE